MQKITFSSTDNLKLCGIWHLPKEKTDKAIILAHGITVDKDEDGIFPDLAKKLCEKGFAVFRFDFRGSGESEGKSVDMTIKGEIEDLKAAVNYVLKSGYKKIGLLGASFGGGIATTVGSIYQNKIKCLCLWNPDLNHDHTFLHPITPWLKQKRFKIRRDFEEKGWSELGSRRFKIGKQLFDEMEKHLPYKDIKKIKIPTMIVHGDCDTKVLFADSQKYIRNLQGKKRVCRAQRF